MGKYFIENETAMLELGKQLAQVCRSGMIIFLRGPLGAGKTTLARGILRGLSYAGMIKSPTYTLVESYELQAFTFYHFDLYRLKHPQELLDIGLEDYLHAQAVCLIEWPEKAAKILPKANILCTIEILEDGNGRNVTIQQE